MPISEYVGGVKVAVLKRDSKTGVFLWVFWKYQNSCSTEHLWTAASKQKTTFSKFFIFCLALSKIKAQYSIICIIFI